MLGNTVGAIYVKVLADTSSLKRSINKAAKDGGTESADIFDDAFERRLEKRLNKSQFNHVFDDQFEDLGRNLALKVAQGGRNGFANINISKTLADEAKRAASELGLVWDDMGEDLQERIADSIDRGFKGGLKDAEGNVRKGKATIGNLLSDVGKDISFDTAIDNAVGQIIDKMPPAVKESIEKGQKNVKWTFARDAQPEIKRIADDFGFAVKDIEAEIRRRIPAAFKKSARDAAREAERMVKDTNRALAALRPVRDIIDDDAFRMEVKKVSQTIGRTITPELRDAIRKGTKVDWDLDASLAPHITALANKFRISFSDASRVVSREMNDGLVKPLSKMDRSMAKLYRSMRRMGSGGFFDGLTTGIGGLIFASYKLGKVLAVPVKLIGKGIGTAVEAAGDALQTLSANMGSAGKMTGKMGEIMSSVGAGIASMFASGPAAIIAVVVALVALESALGAVAVLISAVAAAVVILASALYYTAANLALVVPMIGALGLGFVGLALGGMDAAKGVMALVKAMNETDPKKKAEAMKVYREELKKLGPQARAAVEALEPLIKGLGGLKKEAGEALFDGMSKSIGKAKPLIDALKTGLVQIAGAVGDVIDGFLELGDNATFMRDFNVMLGLSKTLITNIGTAAKNVFAGLNSFFAALAPVAEKFSTALVNITGKFAEWAGSTEGQASILDFFQTAYDIGSQVWDILVELGGALHDLLTAGATEGATKDFLTWMLEEVGKLRDWINEMSESGKLEEWFNSAKEVGLILWDVIKQLGKAFGSLLTEDNVRVFKIIAGLFLVMVMNITLVINVIGTLVGLVAMTFGIIKGAVMAVWYAILLVKDAIMGIIAKFNELRSKGKSVWDSIKGSIQGAKDAVQRFIDRIKSISWPKPPAWLSKIIPGGAAAGGLFFSPTTKLIGEAGPEAVIPLTRPLSQVAPGVRGMASLIRGGSGGGSIGGGGGNSRSVVNNWSISSSSADPRAIAAQVMNRSVAMAG